ncbi:MAG: hypothetical protein GY867_01465 [bacterium]|nr:hypothetical protein [bacterium]
MGIFATLAASLCLGPEVRSQGSVFGEVSRSDLSTPADSDLVFFGFIHGTDDEIRLSVSDGAGFDVGFWFDDFQNYLDEAPNVRFDYFFFDTTVSEWSHISATILAESIQQEDVTLTETGFPSAPSGLGATRETAERIVLYWDYDPQFTYHVYRRTQPSNGSFFRLDDPAGRLVNPGVADSVFVDTTAVDGVAYDYVLIAEDGPAEYSPASAALDVSAVIGCCLPPSKGDIDQSGSVDITDLQVFIDHQFLTLQPLICVDEGDLDLNGDIDITDLQILIDNQFLTLTPLPACH